MGNPGRKPLIATKEEVGPRIQTCVDGCALQGICDAEIERLARARDQLAEALTEANKAVEKIAKERDEARASALKEAALHVVTGKHGAVLHSPSPERTEMSDEILALIDKPAPKPKEREK